MNIQSPQDSSGRGITQFGAACHSMVRCCPCVLFTAATNPTPGAELRSVEMRTRCPRDYQRRRKRRHHGGSLGARFPWGLLQEHFACLAPLRLLEGRTSDSTGDRNSSSGCFIQLGWICMSVYMEYWPDLLFFFKCLCFPRVKVSCYLLLPVSHIYKGITHNF